MAQKTVAAVIGRAAVSKDFLNKLKSTPDEALAEYSEDLTPEEVSMIKNLDHTELDSLNQSTTNTALAAFIDKGI